MDLLAYPILFISRIEKVKEEWGFPVSLLGRNSQRSNQKLQLSQTHISGAILKILTDSVTQHSGQLNCER
jgi:hypothetical protein